MIRVKIDSFEIVSYGISRGNFKFLSKNNSNNDRSIGRSGCLQQSIEWKVTYFRSISSSALPLTRVDLVSADVFHNEPLPRFDPLETLTIRVVGRRSGTRRSRITVTRRPVVSLVETSAMVEKRRGVRTEKWYSVNSQWTTGWCYVHLGFSGIDTPLRMHRPRVEGGCAFSTPPQRRSFCSLHSAGGKRAPLLHHHLSASASFPPLFSRFSKFSAKFPTREETSQHYLRVTFTFHARSSRSVRTIAEIEPVDLRD